VEWCAQLVAHAGYELRLVLARLRELPVLILDFVEQPHILNRDHSLIGKGLDQLDLLVGEWSHDRAVQAKHANRCPFPQERHTEYCTKAASFLNFNPRVFRIG